MKTLTLLVFSAILLLSISSLAANSADDSVEKRSIEDFVSPNGRIDIDAVRKSGYQGPLDLDGINVLIDPKTGEPMVQVSASSATPADPDDIYWDNSISPSLPGVDGIVNALVVYDSNLIAAGEFTVAGEVFANNIASWDGTSWSALGTGMDDTVLALTVYNDTLVAGGQFTTAGGVPANRIASWDGSSWSALGSGTNSSVRALTVYDNTLIAGGDFTSAGNKLSAYLAQWTKGVATDVEEIEYPVLPDGYKLAQNYPNPFNPKTVIEFNLPRRSNVSITIFNLLGQQVLELVNEEIAAGSYRVSWDGILSSGQRASSGIYFYRLVTEDFIDTKKMILLK